ncbi:MAG: hypothetical protein ACKV2Q_04165 [Planctomycetaceae bacterium]
MKTALRLSCGLLLIVSVVGCRTCQHSCGEQSCQPQGCSQHKGCLSKLFKGKGKGGCGCHSDCGDGCGGGQMACDCGHPHGRHKSHKNYDLPGEAAMYGYDKSVVYTGEDYQGIPQQGLNMMPMPGGCSGCAGGHPMMGMPSTGCAGCAGPGMSPMPSEGMSVPQSAPSGGCASCGGNHPTPGPTPMTPMTPATPPAGGGCASCGANASSEAFYHPMGLQHHNPVPAPPAEGGPQPAIEAVPGGEPIQKIHWVPRQL